MLTYRVATNQFTIRYDKGKHQILKSESLQPANVSICALKMAKMIILPQFTY